jgi:hypothetical protein
MKALLTYLLDLLPNSWRTPDCGLGFHCHRADELATAGEPELASSFGVRMGDGGHQWVMVCSGGCVGGKGCTRFESIREDYFAGRISDDCRSRLRLAWPTSGESHLFDRYGYVPGIYDLDVQPGITAFCGSSGSRGNHEPDSIPSHCPPSVDDAKHGAQQSNGNSHRVDPQLVHSLAPESPSESVALLDRFAVICGLTFAGIVIYEAAWLCIVAPFASP